MIPNDGLGALIIVGFTLLGLYIKAYVVKKAENFADRNDLVELNRKIEEIKSQNSNTLALVNANLSLASKGIETFDSEQFKSYIAFHQTCSYILNDVSTIESTSMYFLFLDIEFLRKHASLMKEVAQYSYRSGKAH